jgi:CubicO group peptidase (beta-lactamase class C family)
MTARQRRPSIAPRPFTAVAIVRGAAVACALLAACTWYVRPKPAAPDVRGLMQRGHVNGLAIAVIESGYVGSVSAYGKRSVERDLPLRTDTIMPGASLTKTAFAYLVLQYVDEGRLTLDTPLAKLLPKPLPDYEEFADLTGDDRWRALTPRIVLTHTTGLANFRWLEDDKRLRFHFTPGTRYGYSGEGFSVLQLAIEEGLHVDVGREMQARVFDRFGLKRTSMTWREDFAANLADGYTLEGTLQPHDRRRRADAAGSMDTTIGDQAKLWSGILRGVGLGKASRAELVRPQATITSAHQFPTLRDWTDPRNEGLHLSAGLGLVTFEDKTGPAFFKGGHDDGTGNMVVCLEKPRRCVVLMSNDVRAERIYPDLVALVLGPTKMPWSWEYGWLESP